MTSGYGDGADRFAQQLIGDLPEVSRSVVAYKLGALMLSGISFLFASRAPTQLGV